MLVLSRQGGQSIVMHLPSGETIRIKIKEAHGNRARIGIDAPDSVRILREELGPLDDPKPAVDVMETPSTPVYTPNPVRLWGRK